MLYPLSYGRIVFGAQCTIANYSITASFLQVLYWVDEIKNIIKKQEGAVCGGSIPLGRTNGKDRCRLVLRLFYFA